MSFQLHEMRAMEQPMARVVVAEVQGSAPREVGASMLVFDDGISGTIGGGALEHLAIERARLVLESGKDRFDRIPLGPSVAQCCGGAVALLTEFWDVKRLLEVTDIVARPLPSRSGDQPLSVARVLASGRNSGATPATAILDGWMIEPVQRATRDVWVWGAGHVGRALIAVLAPFPDIKLHWADTDRSRFPNEVPESVTTLFASNPADLVSLAAPSAEHFVLTFSHSIDLEICHRLLGRPFLSLGLIGSETKRARFRKRLAALGHEWTQIDRIQCPIGDKALGKRPQAIALGVAADVLREGELGVGTMEDRA